MAPSVPWQGREGRDDCNVGEEGVEDYKSKERSKDLSIHSFGSYKRWGGDACEAAVEEEEEVEELRT